LNEVVPGTFAVVGAAESADDSLGNCLADAVWIADGQCDVDDLYGPYSCWLDRLQVVSVDTDDCKVCFRVPADQLR